MTASELMQRSIGRTTLDETEIVRSEKNEEQRHPILFDDSFYACQALLAGSF
jgi:hypothetical protein